MALLIPSPLEFTVTRHEPELVTPAKPTPHEFKELSDIDDQQGLRAHLSGIQFYRNSPSMCESERDPVKVIKEALSQTLVFYYPLAGRLREGPGGKLIVECSGQGVLFIEADADVALERFVEAKALFPPHPFLKEVLYDVPGSGGILNCPLLLFQVTRLRCGGFIFAFRFNHTMTDGIGILQFLMAMGEMARGASSPFVQPVWQRELLYARNPPHVTCTHHAYDDEVVDVKSTIIPEQDEVVLHSFFFGSKELSNLRRLVPPHMGMCSTFELLTAFLWKCRTIALQLNLDEEVRITFATNSRRYFNPPLPIGYYGNVVASPVALSTVRELSFVHALELVTKTKSIVTQEFMRSTADLLVIRGRPHFRIARTFVVSDISKAKFTDIDFGWGKAVYAGPAFGEMEVIHVAVSFYIAVKNEKGEDGIVVLICLPTIAMKRFVLEIESNLKGDHSNNSKTSMSFNSKL